MTTEITSGIESQSAHYECFEALPEEVLFKIFYHVVIVSKRPKALGTCAQVCRQWKAVSEDDRIWRTCAMISFNIRGRQFWKQSVGCVVKDPSHYRQPDGNPIPWKKVYKERLERRLLFSVTPKSKTGNPERDLLVPKTIDGAPTTINKIVELFSKKGVKLFIDEGFLKIYGDIPVEESYFIRMTLLLDCDTRNKMPSQRIRVIDQKGEGLYRLPKAIEHLVYMLLGPMDRNGYEQAFTQYVETMKDEWGERTLPVIGGGFRKMNSSEDAPYCFVIAPQQELDLEDSVMNDPEFLRSDIGAAAVREF